MDEKPFFEFKITDIRDADIGELKKFHKSVFDLENISSAASDLKYFNELKILVQSELHNPNEDFVRYFARQIHTGPVTAKVLSQFTGLTKKVFNQIINEQISERLKSALKKQEEPTKEPEEDTKEESLIVTTQEEIDAFLIVKSILRKEIEVGRIYMRDTQSYCGVLLDDNNRKPVCRFHFNGAKFRISLFDAAKKETRHEIDSLDDIYKYSEQIIETAKNYDGN